MNHTMRKYILIFIFSISYTLTYAQKAFVVFTSHQNCEMNLFEPIDNNHNNLSVTRTLNLVANLPSNCEIDIDEFAFVECEIPFIKKFSLLLFPNDTVYVDINKEITFRGKNKEGLQYMCQIKGSLGTLYYSPMQESMLKYVQREKDFSSSLQNIRQNIEVPVLNSLEENLAHTSTSRLFVQTLKKELQIELNSYLLLLLTSTLAVDDYKVVAMKDSLAITHSIDSIFKTTIPFNKQALKYKAYNFFAQYLVFYYEEEKMQTPDVSFLGSFYRALYVPKNMQPFFIGNGCLLYLKTKRGRIDIPQTLEYLKQHFPDNEYTSVIARRTEGSIGNQKDKLSLSYITQNIDSLSQLASIPELSGKYLFIDLWASWCMPCRKEFAHKDALEKLLKSYGNVCTIFLSIDNKEQESAWKQCIQNFQLNGWHLLASKELKESIQKQIFGLEGMTIPRYALINPQGEVLHKDLPRPSNMLELKMELNKLLNH